MRGARRPKRQPTETYAEVAAREEEAAALVREHGVRRGGTVGWPTRRRRGKGKRIFNPTHRASAALDLER